jgi:hypothetical protein
MVGGGFGLLPVIHMTQLDEVPPVVMELYCAFSRDRMLVLLSLYLFQCISICFSVLCFCLSVSLSVSLPLYSLLSTLYSLLSVSLCLIAHMLCAFPASFLPNSRIVLLRIRRHHLRQSLAGARVAGSFRLFLQLAPADAHLRDYRGHHSLQFDHQDVRVAPGLGLPLLRAALFSK